MGKRIPFDDLALERAAARLYAMRFADIGQGLAAWNQLLPSRKQAMRDEVHFAHRWFEAIAQTDGTESDGDRDGGAPAPLDPRIPALLSPRSNRGRPAEAGPPPSIRHRPWA